jgi:hypothetical protein
MFSKKSVTTTFTTLFTTLLLASIAPQTPSKADPAITIDTDGETWFLRTSAPDPEASAYGGRLRIYDIHVAKMVEVTHHHCATSRFKAAFWRYYANGEVMGRFRVSCDVAKDLVKTHGLGKSHPTLINLIGTGSSTIDIPTIDISGDKAYTWMRFTQNFKPIR